MTTLTHTELKETLIKSLRSAATSIKEHKVSISDKTFFKLNEVGNFYELSGRVLNVEAVKDLVSYQAVLKQSKIASNYLSSIEMVLMENNVNPELQSEILSESKVFLGGALALSSKEIDDYFDSCPDDLKKLLEKGQCTKLVLECLIKMRNASYSSEDIIKSITAASTVVKSIGVCYASVAKSKSKVEDLANWSTSKLGNLINKCADIVETPSEPVGEVKFLIKSVKDKFLK